MKYCQTCGAELNDLAEICPKCGVRCAKPISSTQNSYEHSDIGGKTIRGTGAGVLLTLFLGIIGWALCYFLGDYFAKKSATKTLIISLIVGVAISIIIFLIISLVAAGSYY